MALNITLKARIVNNDGDISVIAFTDPGVCDRHDWVAAWCVRTPALAKRLVRAIEAGKVVVPTGLATDVNGKTYVQTDHEIRGRTMNADLKRLGF